MSLADRLPAAETQLRPWPRLVRLASELWRYLAASLVALAVDFGLLVLLTEKAHLPYLVSAAIGFTAGLLVTYALSVRLVFRERPLDRRAELAGFIVIGLLGLGLNELLLRILVGGLGLHYALAKVPAAGVSFLFNFAARRILLFSARRGPADG